MSWIRLCRGNDWGADYFYHPERPKSASGTYTKKDGLTFKEGQEIRVKWPDGTQTVESVRHEVKWSTVSDMGRSERVTYDLPGVIVTHNGASIWFALDAFEVWIDSTEARLPKYVLDALEVKRFYNETALELGPQPRFTVEEEAAIKGALYKAFYAGETRARGVIEAAEVLIAEGDNCMGRAQRRAFSSLEGALADYNKAHATGESIATNSKIPRTCNGCSKPLRLEHLFVDDGCPCNSPRGCNFTPMPCAVCREHCVKPGHHVPELFGIAMTIVLPATGA